MAAEYLRLPTSIGQAAERWLTDIETSLVTLETSAVSLSRDEATALRDAIADVRTCTSFAMAVLSGDAPVAQRAPSRWVPITRPSPELAAIISSVDDLLKDTPWKLVDSAKSVLDDYQRHAFLQIVGDVLGSIFTNLIRAVWNEYPEHAPADWKA
jgi:hypothetical protein